MGNPNMVPGVTGEMSTRLPWSGPHLLSHLFSTPSLYSNRRLPSWSVQVDEDLSSSQEHSALITIGPPFTGQPRPTNQTEAHTPHSHPEHGRPQQQYPCCPGPAETYRQMGSESKCILKREDVA